jgi:hypothetical protein
MKASELDWNYIRQFTLIPTITFVLAVAVLFVSMHVQGSQAKLHEQLTADQAVMQEDYDALVDRRRIVDRYHRRYRQFSEQGFVGMESRLDWIETLRAKTSELTLPRVSYALQPQLKAIAPVQSIMAGDDISIHVSNLDLEMGLVHELDLLRFVDELQQHAPGLIKVDRCYMSWQGEGRENLAAESNILANCSLQIYSVITADVSQEQRL